MEVEKINLERAIVFDVEANGFLEDATEIHCIAYVPIVHDGVKVLDGGNQYSLYKDPFLTYYDTIIGHNIISYDIPLIHKLCGIDLTTTHRIFDTYLMSMLSFADRQLPDNCPASYTDPVTGLLKRIGPHSLESWIYRVNSKSKKDLTKIHISDVGWETYTPEIRNRCVEDVIANKEIFFELCKEMNIGYVK